MSIHSIRSGAPTDWVLVKTKRVMVDGKPDTAKAVRAAMDLDLFFSGVTARRLTAKEIAAIQSVADNKPRKVHPL